MAVSYTKTQWVNDSAPAISANNLNKIEQGIYDACEEINEIEASTIPVTRGGTGATTAEGARTNLGLGSVATESTVPISKGGTGSTTAEGSRTNLGLGSVATESTVPISKGGTGATTAANARTALGLGNISTKSIATSNNVEQKKLVWTNGSPTSSFAAQSLTISGITTSDLLEVHYKDSATESAYTVMGFSGSSRLTLIGGTTAPNDVWFRTVVAASGKITFGDAKYAVITSTTVGTNNARLVPYKIFKITNL